MKIKVAFFYLIILFSSIFSYTIEDMMDKNGLMNRNNSQEFDNSLQMNTNSEFMSIYEAPINPKEYRVGVGDSFLFTMIYPAGAMNTQLIVSPVGAFGSSIRNICLLDKFRAFTNAHPIALLVSLALLISIPTSE